VHDVKDVPVSWIFEHFCKLKQKLDGNDVKIKSIFNPKEKTPSMCIYVDEKKQCYRYKDFSTGKSGSAIDMIKDFYCLDYRKAVQLIVEQYNDFVLHNNGGYDVQQFKQASRYKVDNYELRGWTTQDQYYWTQYNIGSRLLEEFCVKPLKSYRMTKDTGEGEITLTITGNYIYGYFTKEGDLYKIYQPKVKDKKFLKVKNYVQGSDQLTGQKWLVITSSLKDIMSLKSLKLTLDYLAPDSENTMIRKEMMEKLMQQYEKIIVLFDYDEAGVKAMAQYQAAYPGIGLAVLPMSKDPSDSIKDYGAKEVRNRLVPIINKKLEEVERSTIYSLDL
jgi:hypothetical protein